MKDNAANVSYKRLPNGEFSRFSLNDFDLEDLSPRNGLSRFNGMTGRQLYDWRNADSQEISLRLAALFRALRTGGTSCRRKNHEVSDADWDFWRGCNVAYLIGFHADGAQDFVVMENVNSILQKEGEKSFAVRIESYRVTPSLLGCSMLASPEARSSLVFDFGHSRIKRGLALYEGNKKCEFKELMPLDVSSLLTLDMDMLLSEKAQELHKQIVSVILSTCKQVSEMGLSVPDEICICIANNVLDGKLMQRGFYGPLSLLCDNYAACLGCSIGQHMGRSPHVSVINDAEAVALLYAGQNAAVITLGTNLGIAYPPCSNDGLKTLKGISYV